VVTIDHKPDIWYEGGRKFYKKDWQAWVPKGVTLHAITGRSEDPKVIQQVSEICPYIDFLFIDGLHTYEAVKTDFNNYSPMVRADGIVALHDIIDNPKNPVNNVSRLFAELKAAGYKTQAIIANPKQTKFGTGVIFL
jgi:hypothetical protein